MTDWDKRFLNLAGYIASWSKDPRTKVGCVIVDNRKRIVSVGYNGFPRGVSDNVERYINRETKLKFICHAERNALDQAPYSVENCLLYTTHLPCNECTKSIVQRGIVAICSYDNPRDYERFNWEESKQMLKEAGISIKLISTGIEEDYPDFVLGEDLLF